MNQCSVPAASCMRVELNCAIQICGLMLGGGTCHVKGCTSTCAHGRFQPTQCSLSQPLRDQGLILYNYALDSCDRLKAHPQRREQKDNVLTAAPESLKYLSAYVCSPAVPELAPVLDADCRRKQCFSANARWQSSVHASP